jgi:hypothetical protein
MEVSMKRFTLLFTLVLVFASQSVFASFQQNLIRNLSVQGVQDLIDWEVGEFTSYNIEFIFPGTLKKEVTSEEKGSIWVTQVMSFEMLGDTEVKMKISRSTAEILEFYVNGEKQDPPAPPKVDIVEQVEDTITVPAGTFETIKVTLKDLESDELTYLWINPRDVAMEGLVQMESNSQFGPMVLKLTESGVN